MARWHVLMRWLVSHKRSVAALATVMVMQRLLSSISQRRRHASTPPVSVSFSDFLQMVKQDQVASVVLSAEALAFSRKGAPADSTFITRPVTVHAGVVRMLDKYGVKFDQLAPSRWKGTGNIALALIPFLYLAACCLVFYKFYNQSAGGDVGQSAKRLNASDAHRRKTSFADVAGVDEAKAVVREVADFLKSPGKYEAAGARLPTGILLIGPPGTGKTLLARAIADDAGLPFFYCSGSDFVEVFAGRGAGRVRNLFAKAARVAPSVIFFDEIDALGKMRGGGLSMNEEREQTLNQLLAAMDGFDSDKRVVVMAATNRYDVLDKALVRPGRFDRVVRLSLPNEQGRLEILRVHTRNKSLEADADLRRVAALSPGMSGAELAMVANEAAICAARCGKRSIGTDDLLTALGTFKHARSGAPSPALDILRTIGGEVD